MSQIIAPTPEIIDQFNRDGFLVFPAVLSPTEIATLKAGVEKAFASHNDEAEIYHMQQIWRPKMFEHGEAFEALIDHPGVAQLIDHLLGDDCHLIANSALRTSPGKTISSWHADETVRFPIPRGVTLDPRIAMPACVINVHYYLDDVDEEVGPTQFVPGSHRSGLTPDERDMDAAGNPSWNNQRPFNAVGPAGTAVIWHDQTWHRGGPNYSKNRYRWAIQTPYARRWISQRFYPFMNYRLRDDIIARATPRRKRLLGFHDIGSYG